MKSSLKNAERRLHLGGDIRPGLDLRVLWNDDNPIADIPPVMIHVGATREGKDGHVTANADILVEDGALDMAIVTDADGQTLDIALVVIRAHHNRILDDTPG